MTKTTALRFIVAAKDNAVLAAWACVVHEYRLPADAEISPYDAWEAYQEFFSLGLVTSTAYDSTDIKREFFTKRPPSCDLQEVLSQLLFLCPEHQPEESMKPKIPSNPFADGNGNGAALTTRDKGSLAPSNGGSPLPANSTSAPLSPFSRETLPQKKDHAFGMSLPVQTGSPAAISSGLPCTRNDDGNELRPEIFCGRCGERLDIREDGSQGIMPDDLPEGNVSILEAIWYSECFSCGLVYHCSVGRIDIPHEAYR